MIINRRTNGTVFGCLGRVETIILHYRQSSKRVVRANENRLQWGVGGCSTSRSNAFSFCACKNFRASCSTGNACQKNFHPKDIASHVYCCVFQQYCDHLRAGANCTHRRIDRSDAMRRPGRYRFNKNKTDILFPSKTEQRWTQTSDCVITCARVYVLCIRGKNCRRVTHTTYRL